MPSPIAAPSSSAPSVRRPQAVAPLATKPETPAREGTPGESSFAELLAEADAVRDLIDVRRRAAEGPGNGPAGLTRGVQGALQGATALLTRQPWLGLALLRRPAAPTGRAQARQTPAVQPQAGHAD